MNARSVFGILLIILGLGLLLGGEWWPLLIVAFGLYKISTDKNSITFGIAVFLAGLLLLALNLGILPGGFWDYAWPLILILIGISLLSNRFIYGKNQQITENELNHFVVFGGSKEIVNTDDFQGGSVTAVFGGTEIDLRHSDIISENVYLEITAVFGGIDLIVPQNWKLEVKGTPILGGMDNKTHYSGGDNEIRPVLQIRYTAVFGGIDVKN